MYIPHSYLWHIHDVFLFPHLRAVQLFFRIHLCPIFADENLGDCPVKKNIDLLFFLPMQNKKVENNIFQLELTPSLVSLSLQDILLGKFLSNQNLFFTKMIQNCKTLERLFTKLFAKLTEKGRSGKKLQSPFQQIKPEKILNYP